MYGEPKRQKDIDTNLPEGNMCKNDPSKEVEESVALDQAEDSIQKIQHMGGQRLQQEETIDR